MKQAFHLSIALMTILLLSLNSQAATAQTPTHKVQGKRLSPQSPALFVVGNKLKIRTGETVRLQGVNIPSLEWSDTGDSQLMQSVDTALSVWHANAIRLPLSQDRWFGVTDKQLDDGVAYRKVVDSVVQAISAKRAYVIIDLHWSNGGAWGKDIAQHNMPDLNSIFFWKDAAAHFANNPAVLFDLYNEPHDVSWDIWKSGGMVTESDKKRGTEKTYRTPGMQKLLDTVRATGAKNIVVAGGLDWAYDLSGVMNGHALDDPGVDAVMYATHIYPWKGSNHLNWDPHVTIAAAKYPILVGEVGCEPDAKQIDPATWAPRIIDYINEHQLNWTAWCFHPSASPRLLADWNYTPTAYWGKFVYDDLTKGK